MAQISMTIPANEARSNFYQILEEADNKLRQFIVTLRGKTKAVIMSFDEFAGWQETLEIMTDKSLKKEVRKGLAEIRSGKGITQAKADKLLKWS